MFAIELLIKDELYIQRTPTSKILRINSDGKIINKYESVNDLPLLVRNELKLIENMHSHPDEYFKYETKKDGTIKLIDFIAPDLGTLYTNNLIIPEYIDGRIVTELNDHLFATTNHCGIENLIMPNSINQIGKSLCEHNINLKRIKLSENLTEIPTGCFANCEKLSYIELPDNIKTLRDYCFFGCHDLAKINFPKNLEEIKSHAFASSGLTGTITLPETLIEIGDAAFRFCKFDRINVYKNTVLMNDAFNFEEELRVYEYNKTNTKNIEEVERL